MVAPEFDLKSIYQIVLKSVFTVFLLLCSMGVFGQTNVSYTAFTTPTCPANPVATISTPPTGLTFSQMSRGAGVTCGNTASCITGSGFNGTLAANISASKWFTFSITSDASNTFTLNSLSIVSRVSSITGSPTVSVQYSIGAGAKTLIGTYTPTASPTAYTITPSSAISVGAGQVLNIFIIPVGLTASNTTARVENATSVNVTGTSATSAPTVTTTTAASITTTSSSSGGNVTADGGASVTGKGIAYGITANPTITGTKTSDGTGTGSFTSSLSSLSVNTKYFYRAYATNSAGTGYGTESSFFTLANTPSAPTVGNPATNSLDVSVTSGDGNPASTEYAIYETTTGNYIQAGGTLGASAVWQTASTWGTKTVTGLTPSTTYTFEVKARNGDNVETAYSTIANGTTAANSLLTYANLQWPLTLTVDEGGTSANVYAQAYKSGYTDAAGAAPGLQVWIGISPQGAATSSDPATWTKWVLMSYDLEVGSNDQYILAINTLTEGLTPGTYRYASRFRINTGSYQYGGFSGGFWDGTSNVSGTLTVNSNLVNGGQVTLNPTTTPEGTSSVATLEIYEPGLTDVAYNATKQTVQFAYIPTTDSNPSTWSGWVTSTNFADSGNNDKYTYTLPNNLAVGTYYVAARVQKTGSTEWQYFGNTWNTWSNSAVLTVNSNKVNWANIQSPVSGTIVEGGAYNVYSQVHKPGITGDANSHAGITAWIGYNSSNAAPTAGGWTWVLATRNTGFSNGSNDEYTADIGTGRTAGTYYYASRYQMSGSSEYFYGGHAGAPDTGGEWGNPAANISGTLVVQSAREINLKQNVTNIATGGSYAFANQISGTSSSVFTFTVENTGQEDLSVGALTISGANASEFTITQVSATLPQTVAGSASTTFTVTFSPTSTGSKTAQLSLVNNDANESPYLINLTGTGTASAASDIVVKSGYIYPQNIAYTNYQATDITGGANDIEVAKFTIRDGGATADADNLGTTLSDLTLNIPNFANIRRIAIYDGTTELGLEQPGSTSTFSFFGLNLTAPDGGTKDFSVRVSFKTAVTDNQQITIGITSTTTAVATGSTFANTSAGGAITSNASDNNRIEVTADRLAFTTQPVNGAINVNLTPFTISARDVNSNLDLDANNNVALTTTGTGMTSTSPYTMTAGVLNISNVQFNAVQTGITLTGTTTGLASINTTTSSAFDILAIVYSSNDYKTITGSGLLWSDAAIWQRSDGNGGWNAAGADGVPSSVRNVYIYGSMSSNGSRTANKIIIESGGILTISAASTCNTQTLVKDGGTLTITGILTNNGNFEIEDNATVNFNNASYSASSLSTSLWNGTEIFHPNSNFVIQNQASSASDFFIPTNNDISANAYNGFTACFGNLIFDSSGTATYPMFGGAFTKNLTHGNLIFRSTTFSSNAVRFTSSSLTTIIGGNLIMESGFNRTVNLTTAAITGSLTINGDFINESAKPFNMVNNASGNITMAVNGNLKINATNSNVGTLNLSSAGTSLLNLKGNLTVGTSGVLNSTSASTFNFTGTSGTQTIDVANAATASNITFNATPNSYVKLINQDFSLGTNSKFNVLNGATLDFGFNGNTALNLTANGSLQTFSAASGSTLKITSPSGLTTAAASATAGNVQVPVASRTFDPGATYHYIGKSASTQVTGNAIATAAFPLTGNIIVDMETATGQCNASFSKTINTPGTLEIRTGVVTDDSTNGFIGSGNLTMNSANGRYITSKTGPQPALTGTYALTNGVVEFANTSSSASIRVTPQYYNVDVSGTNIIVGGKDFIVNNLLKVTSATAVLTVPSETDNLDAYVVTAKKGIQVVTNGKVIFKNNAQLMQDADAVNSGSVSMEREATIPVSTFNQYAYWSSPVIGQDFKNIFPGNPTSALYHNESNNKFYTSTGAYIPGRGLAVRNPFIASGTAVIKTASLSGTPYNADLSYNLNFTDAQHGYNLVGNPYPSNLNLNQLYLNSSNIASTFLFWDNTSNTEQTQLGNSYTGDSYAKFNALAGDTGTGIPAPGKGAPASNNSKTPNNILKVGQGFMVRAKSSGAAVAFRNTDRITTQTSAQFFGKGGKELVNNRYVVEFVTPRSLVFSNAVVYFENGNNNYAVDDSKLESAVSEGLFTQAEDEKVVINGRSSFVNTDLVKVGTRQFTSGLYSIRLGTKEGIFANGQNIYLKDKQTGIVTNLSVGNYTFQANAGESTGRFEIIYQPETVLATDTKVKENLIVYKDGNNFVVKAQNKKISSLEVFDSAGRLILALKPESIKAIIPAEKINNGLYVLKINQNGEITSKKIIR